MIGYPRVGKSTFFSLLTGRPLASHAAAEKGVMAVADARLVVLTDAFHPKRVTPAQIGLVDTPALRPGEGGDESRRFLAEIRQVDALIPVLAGFAQAGGPPPQEAAETILLELAMADLEIVEKRLDRLAKQKRTAADEIERGALERCHLALSEGRTVRSVGLAKDQLAALRSIGLLTLKPVIYVLNLAEEDLDQGATLARGLPEPVLVTSALIEQEIAQLAPAERQAFLETLGFEEDGISRLSRTVYQHLGLASFLTAGEDEVRAWTIEAGLGAKEAAGKIHSDIARGFIRAEVVAYDRFVEDGLSMSVAKEKGHWRLEGKEYPVQDGDMINFRFQAGR